MCNGDEGRKVDWSALPEPGKPPICFDDADRDLRLGVAWIDENNGFFDCKVSRDGREIDCGTTEKLDDGGADISGTSISPGNARGWDLINMFVDRFAFGVAEICTPWKSGFLIGFLDSEEC